MIERVFYPGTRVKAFDHRTFKDDISTPLSMTMKAATVVCWYGTKSEHSGYIYPDLVDVRYDDEPCSISRGHFVSALEVL